ncbi:hypothetical protein ADUPG1_004437, partial [Aduncisulcus paluster]
GERQHLRIANDKLQDENRLLISQVATLKEQQRAKEQKCSALTDELEKVKGDYNDVSSRLSHLSEERRKELDHSQTMEQSCVSLKEELDASQVRHASDVKT